jgi:flagellar basal body rod protein FlgC
MSDIFSIAAGGIAAATNRFEASAKRVAEYPQANLAGEIVDQKLAGVAVEANIAVLNAANRMAKSLLDILV